MSSVSALTCRAHSASLLHGTGSAPTALILDAQGFGSNGFAAAIGTNPWVVNLGFGTGFGGAPAIGPDGSVYGSFGSSMVRLKPDHGRAHESGIQ